MQKLKIRASMSKWRGGLTKQQVLDMSKKIFRRLSSLKEYRDANNLFVYLPQGNEPHTGMILDAAAAQGKTVSVPVCLPNAGMMACRYERGMVLRHNDYSIFEPVMAQAVSDIDIAIIPGLAFDVALHRLGHGSGYYDRWLKLYRGIVKIGLAYEEQILDRLPYDDMDVTMDLVVTPSRILRRKQY